MRDLDITKKYDLSQLDDEQLQAVLDWLKDNDTGWDNSHIGRLKSSFCILHNEYGEWKLQTLKGNETNAIELFEEELKTYQITEYSTGDFGDLGIKQGIIQATTKDQAWLFHKKSNGLREQEKGFFSFDEIKNKNTAETLIEKGYLAKDTSSIDFKKELPNITFTQDNSVYDDILLLIEKGKQHGLKIVVTFEKL